MYSQPAIALLAALSLFAFAVPTVSHAENQSEWLNRQLQITDGYAPPPVVLPAKDGDRAGASAIRRSASRASPPRKAPRPRAVLQQTGNVYEEAPACRAACAGGERPPAQTGCPKCGVIELAREADMHDEGIGFAAVGVLLAVAGFKVMKIAGALQQG